VRFIAVQQFLGYEIEQRMGSRDIQKSIGLALGKILRASRQ